MKKEEVFHNLESKVFFALTNEWSIAQKVEGLQKRWVN